MDQKRLLTVKETAQILGIAERTIRNGTGGKSKKPFCIKAVRLGRSVRFKASDVYGLIDSL